MLLEKLFSICIIDQCLAVIASLLYGRKFFVVFRTVILVLVAIKSGIPQGGIGSTVLFNIFVINLPSVIQVLFAKLFQYADDCV
jgi:hypothetical protein